MKVKQTKEKKQDVQKARDAKEYDVMLIDYIEKELKANDKR